MTPTSNYIPPLDEEAALNWLRNAAEVETTITALAKVWGWDRSRASRILDRWEGVGLITRRPGSDRNTIFFARPAIPPVDPSSPVVNTLAHGEATAGLCAGPAAPPVHALMLASHTAAPTAEISGGLGPLPVQATCTTVRTIAQPDARPIRPPQSSNVLSIAMFLVALGLGSVGLVMNARFASSFGRSDEAAFILAAIGALIDVLVAILPSVGCHLCRSGSRTACAAAWCLWLFTATMSLLAGAGFGATNIGDAIADRDKVVLKMSGVRATVDSLRAQRTAITETRSAAVLQAQSERERALVDRNVWRATRGCHDVTASDSAAACTAVMATHIAVAAAVRRDALDAELRTAEEKLGTLPAIQAGADPQAEMVAKIIALISIGRITPEAQQIAPIRIIGLALMPIMAGIAMMLGMALRREAAVP
jgi:MarR family